MVSEESAFQLQCRQTDRSYDRTVPPNVLFTIGHSTHSIEEFIAFWMPTASDISSMSAPSPNPATSRNSTPTNSRPRSAPANIAYTHLKALGGRRHSRKDSINTGWRNTSFRGYADYMSTPQFAEGLATLTQIASTTPTAIMCAEAVPWRCHRSLIADAMMLKDWQVRDILTKAPAAEHKLTPFLKVANGQPTYPDPDQSGTLFSGPR